MAIADQVNVNRRLEQIFSQAAALSQAGRLKSEIHVFPGEVFIVNGDNTVLMRFDAPGISQQFSFRTDDYDSEEIKVKEGNAVFIQKTAEWVRKKIPNPVPKERRDQVKAAWARLHKDSKSQVEFAFHRESLNLLNDKMSHIEISCEQGCLTLLQRNIYAGELLQIKENTGQFSLVQKIRPDFKPVALRTNDFLALFAFQNQLVFWLHPQWAFVQGTVQPLYEAFLGGCTYDEMGG